MLFPFCRALALNCDAPLNDKFGAESKNWRAGKPVRVVRSSKGRRISKYAPEEGNRYDGIYKVGTSSAQGGGGADEGDFASASSA